MKKMRLQRKRNRLKNYDYSQDGYYYVTICIKDRKCVLGKIDNNKMKLNNAGKMTQTVWEEIPKFYKGIGIDTFQIMPNHIHGIVIVKNNKTVPAIVPVGTGPRACPRQEKKGQPQGDVPTTRTKQTEKLSLSDVIQRFKSLTTKKYIAGIKNQNWSSFHKKLWQRSFYDHIIRNEKSLRKIRNYIITNPVKWELDKNNPKN